MNIQMDRPALEEIAECLVSDRVTHRILDRKFQELNIIEPIAAEPDKAKLHGLKSGVDYYAMKPSKRNRLLTAVQIKHRESGGNGVLQLIKTIYPIEAYVADRDGFREFCNRINRILRFSGTEYREDGQFHRVTPTLDLSEAERRAKRVENKMATRRVHPEVQKFCKAEYMQEDYFHAVFEAVKGLAERIREKTGLCIDGVGLVRQAFERQNDNLPKLAFNKLTTQSERNEHDGFVQLLVGSFQFFRNPIAHTPRILWQHDIDDAVDCLTMISFLNYRLDECYPTTR